MIINTFQGPVVSSYVAADTETHTLIDGAVLPEEKIKSMMLEVLPDGSRKYPVKWWRAHTEVVPWAYIIYAPEGFAILENFDEYARFISQYHVRHVWWYNAPFDFSILDYDKLTRGWTYTESPKNPREFGELCSEFGVRYMMKEVHAFEKIRGGAPSNKKSQRVTHYDARNLLKGGLRRLLESFDVRDDKGEPIRKREMDYQTAGVGGVLTYGDILYMLDDARGLWWLVQTFGRRLQAQYNIDILGGKPEVLTASGLAKKLMLRKMYPHASDKGAVTLYRRDHPITLELDAFFRSVHLLQGGLVMLNPGIKGRHLTGVNLFRYDYNSHYPAIMSVMPDIRGNPLFVDGEAPPRDGRVRILVFDKLDAFLRPGFIPAWLNPITGKVDSAVEVIEWKTGCIALFDFELDELRLWYDITTYHVKQTIFYKAAGTPCADFVAEHYAEKQRASAEGDKVGKEIPKLTMNGASGKFSQNPVHSKTERVLCEDGHVTLAVSDVTKDERSMMNVVQGAYITAKGRTILRQSCRDIAMEADKTVAECILYTDTDSIHTNVLYSKTDPLALGWLKCENKTPIREAVFIAPKAYAERDASGTEFHSKGVNRERLAEAEADGDSLVDIYRPGRRFLSLSALNVRGGKALLPLPKVIKIKDELDNEFGEEMFF